MTEHLIQNIADGTNIEELVRAAVKHSSDGLALAKENKSASNTEAISHFALATAAEALLVIVTGDKDRARELISLGHDLLNKPEVGTTK